MLLCLAGPVSAGLAAPSASASPQASAARPALRVADFILGLQGRDGAIRDRPGGSVVNEDSNMEYALLGLAAAYRETRKPRYLRGFENGIRWLAGRENMSRGRWRGSWYYAFSARPPYRPLRISPGPGIRNVRGVDTTSAYFAYLLYLDSRLPGNHGLAAEFGGHARAALDFVLKRNRGPAGTTYSSWQHRKGRWRLWRYRYTADQADVYLGMRAGAALFPGRRQRYRMAARRLRAAIQGRFFDRRRGRYAVGLDGRSRDWERDFNAVFPQGYVPWALSGSGRPSRAACRWLRSRVTASGRIVAFRGDPGHSLSASILAMGSKATGGPRPARTIRWLLGRGPFDRRSGGVRDTAARRSARYSNVAGFTVVALLGQPATGW